MRNGRHGQAGSNADITRAGGWLTRVGLVERKYPGAAQEDGITSFPIGTCPRTRGRGASDPPRPSSAIIDPLQLPAGSC